MATASGVDLLRGMLRIRRVEETLADLYSSQEMRTPTHFSIGQEAVAVGVCGALRRDDIIYSGHRCHAHYLAKGGDLAGMVAELYGRETGCARGRGGSVHLNDPDAGIIASSAILGQTMAVAVGTALAFTMDGRDRVAASFFGDGTVEEGIFHETLNFAVMRRAPVLFVCENNGFSTHTRLEARQPATVPIHARAASYGMPARLVDGNDVFAVHEAAREAVAHLRRGDGPFFLECTTYRWREHVGPLWDHDKGYRTKAEVDSWVARCPIRRASERLVADGACTPAAITAMERASQAEMDAAVVAARAASFPAVEDLTTGAY
ncbi:MAG TPA: thiamine pyrophosphate-dependent dehydrogenase E1 component subunit alpha [Methylomirabilota bacterium]|nr:thiamine pyrophosphate-dependent dehydrogenase E1 component subunit alpha [Methylomirabilota bacterium]